MFTVSTAAAQTALTTLATLKTELQITKGTDDAWLTRRIDTVSDSICGYLGIQRAEDGTRNLGRETLVETLDRRSRFPGAAPFGVSSPRREADSFITLARRPVVSIASVTENGTTVDPSNYELSATSGKLKRLSSALAAAWPHTLIVVTYTAGWLMPGESGRTLPPELEQAAIDLLKEARFSRTRDPDIKGEEIMGVRRVDYFFGSPGAGPWPTEVTRVLNDYRNIYV